MWRARSTRLLGALLVAIAASIALPAQPVRAAACAPSSSSIEVSGVAYTVLEFSATGSCDWVVPTGITSIDALIVGGGGGASAGGGGGGGVVALTSQSVTPGATVSVVVGAGGAGNGSRTGHGSLGGSSSFHGTIAYGGGGGAPFDTKATNSSTTASNGGNGSDAQDAQDAVSSGQGNLGGVSGCDWYGGAGGGGGAGGAGSIGGPASPPSPCNSTTLAGSGTEGVDFNPTFGGDGGDGVTSSITGASVEYGAGGGGGVNNNQAFAGVGGQGGSDDAGDGATTNNGVGADAVDGTGAGGGGGDAEGTGGRGGNGVVIVRYTSTASTSTPGCEVAGRPCAVRPWPWAVAHVDRVTVSWEALIDAEAGSGGVTAYRVESNPAGGTCVLRLSEVAPGESLATTCEILGLSRDVDYTFIVFASSAFGEGPGRESRVPVRLLGDAVVASVPQVTPEVTAPEASPEVALTLPATGPESRLQRVAALLLTFGALLSLIRPRRAVG